MKIAGLILGLFLGFAAYAKVDVYEFAVPTQGALYQELIAELRCLVCQNQNIADSNAELARDLRRKTYELVTQGKSKGEIVDYMTQRYGDFVLYKPPLNLSTLILWAGPFLALMVGVIVLVTVVRRQRAAPDNALGDKERSRVRELLNDGSDSR